MKREFLQNFSVNGQPLPKEVIDAILDEHSRGIGAVKADLEAVKIQLQTAKDSLKAFEGVDVSQLQGQIAQLQNDLATKDATHQKEMADIAFNHTLEAAITGAKGRNAKAITALLDLDALRGSKNQDEDIKTALEALMKSDPWAFGDTAGAGAPGAGGMTVQTGGEHGSGGNSDVDDGVIARFRDLNPELKI